MVMHDRTVKNKFSGRSIDINRLLMRIRSGIKGLLCCLPFMLYLTPCLCSAGSVQDKTRNRQINIDQTLSPRIMEFRNRLDHLLSPIVYVYTPAGKPDPFQPFLRAKRAPVMSRAVTEKVKDRMPDHCATPLECMDVGQLRLVAIVMEEDGENMAMAQDASGIGYVLIPGIPVGYRNGHVTKILPDRVIVEEDTENVRGDMTIMERVLFLHPEEK